MEGLERERWERKGVKGLFLILDTRNIEILSAVAFFAHFSVNFLLE
jgi:hypothetical protein